MKRFNTFLSLLNVTSIQAMAKLIVRLNVVVPNITSHTIIGSSCGILVLLFLIQPLGTAKIGSSFAPIVIIWLMFNLAFGIYVSYQLNNY